MMGQRRRRDAIPWQTMQGCKATAILINGWTAAYRIKKGPPKRPFSQS